MKLNNILNYLLIEATTDEIYQKYYSSINRLVFNRIVKADPKTIVDDNNQITKIGPYAKLLLKLYNKNNNVVEDLPNANQYLNIIYNHNIPVDIKNINDLSDLYEIVKVYITKTDLNLINVLSLLKKNKDYQVLFEDSNWILYKPLTELGATYLGFNSTWCTSWGPNSLNDENKSKTNRFHHYNHDGPIYIIINKLNDNEKYQIHVPTNQFNTPNNSNLQTIKRQEIFDKLPQQIKYTIFPEINQNLNIKTAKSHLQLIKPFLNNDDIENFKKNNFNNLNNEYDLLSALNDGDYDMVKEIFDELFSLEAKFHDSNYLSVKFNIRDYDRYDDYLINEFMSYENRLTSTIENYENNYFTDLVDLYIEPIETFKPYLENYYLENQDELNELFNVKNFKEFFGFNMFFINEKNTNLFYEFSSKMTELNLDPVFRKLKNEFKEYENLIEITNSSTYFEINKLIEFLEVNDINNFEYFEQFVSKFIDFIDFDSFYDGMDEDFTNNMYYSYPEDNSFNDDFERILNKLQKTDLFQNDNFICFANKINKVNKLFDDNYNIENNYYIIYYPEFDFNKNCDNFANIKIYDKINKKDLTGYIDPDNIINYYQNIPLDLKESILKNFKRFL